MTFTPNDLANAKLDTTSIAEQATSRAGGEGSGALIDSATNRFGERLDTMRGRLKKLGYQVPVAYASGIAFTVDDFAKSVTYNGEQYAPVVSELPFTTTGTFETSKFYRVSKIGTPVFETLTGSTDKDLAGWGGYSVGAVYEVQGCDSIGIGAASWKCTSIAETGGSAGFNSSGVYRVDNGNNTFSEFENVSEKQNLAQYGGSLLASKFFEEQQSVQTGLGTKTVLSGQTLDSIDWTDNDVNGQNFIQYAANAQNTNVTLRSLESQDGQAIVMANHGIKKAVIEIALMRLQ